MVDRTKTRFRRTWRIEKTSIREYSASSADLKVSFGYQDVGNLQVGLISRKGSYYRSFGFREYGFDRELNSNRVGHVGV